jgi:hypothetical protein
VNISEIFKDALRTSYADLFCRGFAKRDLRSIYSQKRILICNQQVVGSNPTAGSLKSRINLKEARFAWTLFVFQGPKKTAAKSTAAFRSAKPIGDWRSNLFEICNSQSTQV